MNGTLSVLVFFVELFGVGTLIIALACTAAALYFTLLAYLDTIGVEHGWTKW